MCDGGGREVAVEVNRALAKALENVAVAKIPFKSPAGTKLYQKPSHLFPELSQQHTFPRTMLLSPIDPCQYLEQMCGRMVLTKDGWHDHDA